jgi:hypothetical protein
MLWNIDDTLISYRHTIIGLNIFNFFYFSMRVSIQSVSYQQVERLLRFDNQLQIRTMATDIEFALELLLDSLVNELFLSVEETIHLFSINGAFGVLFFILHHDLIKRWF